MKGRTLQVCTRCVMDTTAEEITFDARGVCSFCQRFDVDIKPRLESVTVDEGKRRLDITLAGIRKLGDGKPYDSILGLSGGTDSSYLAHLAVQNGLRPLAIHVDMGWNTTESGQNVRRMVDRLGLDLQTITIDFDVMRRLQIAFYRASVRNCEIPQDHAFLEVLYSQAAAHGVKVILTGGNVATESILPRSWGYNAGDARHLRAIHRKCGEGSLRDYPTLGFFRRYVYYPLLRGIKEVRLLNFVPYNRRKAREILMETYGWVDYGSKHFESVLTRFFQGHYLVAKFGIDKRKAHLSSLILSGQTTRDEALEELKKPPYPSEELLRADKSHIARQLGLSLASWEEILALVPREHNEFPSSKFLFSLKDALVTTTGIRRRWQHGNSLLKRRQMP